jgi:fluoride ion exporter CrcB/FEX
MHKKEENTNEEEIIMHDPLSTMETNSYMMEHNCCEDSELLISYPKSYQSLDEKEQHGLGGRGTRDKLYYYESYAAAADDDDDVDNDEIDEYLNRKREKNRFLSYIKSHLEPHLPSNEYVHFIMFTLLWNILFSSFAACICFWIPGFTIWGISITYMIKNASGCFFIAIVTAFQQVKFQYYHTYIMYDAIKGGFLSVFTSFGNFIEDSDILLGMRWGWLKAPINYFFTLFLSFLCYQLGRLLALKWKAGAAFSFDLMVMENEQHRMSFELASHESELDLSATSSSTTTSTTTKERQSIKTRKPLSKAERLRKYMDQQMIKKKTHKSRDLQGRHIVIMMLLGIVPFVNGALVAIVSMYDWRRVPSSVSNSSYKILWFEFIVSMFWCISGSLAGRYISGLSLLKQKKTDIQWGTFRVNMLSCIFIGTAHNILFLRQSFPYGTTRYFEIVFKRFISDFCGSESSFAGLIDETTVLWNSKRVNRFTPLKNLFYNLIVVCIIFSY